MKHYLFVTFLVIAAGNLFADDNSARRYAALERNAITSKYFLLSTKQAQDNLKLTPEQIATLKSAMTDSPTNIPAVVEHRRLQKQLLEAAKSDEERTKIRRTGNEKVSKLIHQNWEMVLKNTLSPAQQKNLSQLYFQMKGPIVLLEDTNAAQQLNLTKDQMNQLKDVAKSDDELLTPLRHRFLGLQIQPARQRERTDLESEIESIARVIKEVEKDEDSELLAVLSKEQKNSWSEIRGAPISIDWKMDYFSDTPFVEN